MNIKNQILIGVSFNYQKDKIEEWVKTMRSVNNDCRIILASATEFDKETLAFLNYYNVNVIYYLQDLRYSVHLYRFSIVKNILDSVLEKYYYDTDEPIYVLCTDVRDVKFQLNPFPELIEVLKQNDKQILAGTEGLTYKNEKWNYNNMVDCYSDSGVVPMMLLNKEVVNVGVLFGYLHDLRDLCMNIFLTGVNRPSTITDQICFNALLLIDGIKNKFKFVTHDDGVICHCGTTLDPTKMQYFKENLLCNVPIIADNGEIRTNSGKTYPIVHQYDRIQVS